jgi:CelD/BcsL family acetyltransferase involved in cellulose biosynthesis
LSIDPAHPGPVGAGPPTAPPLHERGPRLVVRSSLGGSAGAWDECVDATPLPSPFSRSWWLGAVARGRPRFLLVYEGAELIGGLALEEHRTLGLPILRTMGSGPLCPDHLDLLARPGNEATVERSIRDWLTRPGVRVIDFEGVAAGSRLARLVPHAHPTVTTVAPWMTVPADPERFLATRSANVRANVRKASRRLAREGVVYRNVPPASVDEAIHTLRSLHVARWGTSAFLTVFDRFAVAAQAGVRAREFSFHELVAGDAAVASVAVFEVAGRVSFYQGGRSPDPRWRSAGTILLYRVMQDAARRGVAEFDLLRGDEPYKMVFATGERSIVSVRAARGVAGHAVLAGSDAYRRARRTGGPMVRSIGRRLGVMNQAR